MYVSSDWCLPHAPSGEGLGEAAMVTTVHREDLSAMPSRSLVMKVRTDAASQQGHQTMVSRAAH